MVQMSTEEIEHELGFPFHLDSIGLGTSTRGKVLFRFVDEDKKLGRKTRIKLITIINGEGFLLDENPMKISFSSSPFRSMVYAGSKDFIEVASLQEFEKYYHDIQVADLLHHYLVNIIRKRLGEFFVLPEDVSKNPDETLAF
jgi:hypothetical protein